MGHAYSLRILELFSNSFGAQAPSFILILRLLCLALGFAHVGDGAGYVARRHRTILAKSVHDRRASWAGLLQRIVAQGTTEVPDNIDEEVLSALEFVTELRVHFFDLRRLHLNHLNLLLSLFKAFPEFIYFNLTVVVGAATPRSLVVAPLGWHDAQVCLPVLRHQRLTDGCVHEVSVIAEIAIVFHLLRVVVKHLGLHLGFTEDVDSAGGVIGQLRHALVHGIHATSLVAHVIAHLSHLHRCHACALLLLVKVSLLFLFRNQREEIFLALHEMLVTETLSVLGVP